MKANGKLDPKVDLEYLASKTRNFSGAEIEGLVRSAQATAMNKIIKVRCYMYMYVHTKFEIIKCFPCVGD